MALLKLGIPKYLVLPLKGRFQLIPPKFMAIYLSHVIAYNSIIAEAMNIS